MSERRGLLFVSSIRLPEEDNATAGKKWTGLAKQFDVYVICFFPGGLGHVNRFDCQFYGLPANLWLPIRVLLYYLLVPFLTAYLSLRYSIRNWTTQGPYEAAAVWPVKFALKPLLNPRLIIEAHGDWIKSFVELRSPPFPGFWSRVLERLSPLLLFAADGFRSVSDTTRTLLEEYSSGDRPHLTFPGFTDLDVFLGTERAEKLEREQPFLLYVGALTELKGVGPLLEALELARDKNSQLSLKLCGAGDQTHFQNRAHELGLTDHVEFLGELPQKKLRDRYLESRLLVLPSRTEGLPRVLLECLACYTPFVATKTPGSKQIQRESKAGRIVSQNDTRGLSKAMLDLFEDETSRRQLGDRGRRYVEQNYSNEQFFETYVELVERIN